MRDPDVSVSIFDPDAFKFYIIKYGEILGIDSLAMVSSHDRTISYDQKVKTVAFILKTESELGVTESSWKHCLMFLYHNGNMTKEQLLDKFTTPEAIERTALIKARAESFESVPAKSKASSREAFE
jgi:hypothetical protein